ncbi:hypothetical protein M422DRAFT_242779 [Sphaerobolus stellatus SS14]|nr:hypothetical protein M422DRAFT_242779 [Sphaerobolus stellatus SS14]
MSAYVIPAISCRIVLLSLGYYAGVVALFLPQYHKTVLHPHSSSTVRHSTCCNANTELNQQSCVRPYHIHFHLHSLRHRFMYCVIVVHLTVDDDGNGRDEDTGMSGSGLTWRRVVLGGGGGRLEGKDATRRMLQSSHLTKPQYNSMRNVDSDCIPAYPSPTALRGALRFQERHTHILPQRVTVKVKLRLFEAYTIFASILTSAPRKLRYRLPAIHLKPIRIWYEAAAQFNAQRRLRLHTRIPVTYCITWCITIPKTPHPHPASTSHGEGQAATL